MDHMTPPDGPATPERIAVAFGLTCAAGFAIVIGAILTFLPCVNLKNKKFMSAALAFASGVMLYIALSTVLSHSIMSFGVVMEKNNAYTLATGYFFCGILLTLALHRVAQEVSSFMARKKPKEKMEEKCCEDGQNKKESATSKEKVEVESFSVSSDETNEEHATHTHQVGFVIFEINCGS